MVTDLLKAQLVYELLHVSLPGGPMHRAGEPQVSLKPEETAQMA